MSAEMKVMLVDDNEIDLYLHEKMLNVAGIYAGYSDAGPEWF